MLKGYRRRFVVSNMIIVGAVLLAAFLILGAASYRNNYNELKNTMSLILRPWDSPNDSFRSLKDDPQRGDRPNGGQMRDDMPEGVGPNGENMRAPELPQRIRVEMRQRIGQGKDECTEDAGQYTDK